MILVTIELPFACHISSKDDRVTTESGVTIVTTGTGGTVVNTGTGVTT